MTLAGSAAFGTAAGLAEIAAAADSRDGSGDDGKHVAHGCSPTWMPGSAEGYIRIFGGNGKTAPAASRSCGAVACRSSTRRLPPAHRPGSGVCRDIRRSNPAQPVFRRPRSSPPPCFCSGLTRSNRRGTDPYARWWGSGGAARRPPIPINRRSAADGSRACGGVGPSRFVASRRMPQRSEGSLRVILFAMLFVGLASPLAAVAEPVLNVTAGGTTRQFTAAELLGWSIAATLSVSDDPSYGRAMSYRAVPLRSLLAALPPDTADTIQARASDGFVAEIPHALVSGAATPWVAFEEPAHPWPLLRGKLASAGPFYLVWKDPERAAISPEQWVYALAALTAVPSPAQRWPAIAADPSVPENAPARHGQTAFIANCLPCHRLGGAGEGKVGPDLLRPMPATAYLTESGLHALMRNSAGVRDWPARQMPAFDEAALPNSTINSIIAYLQHLAMRPK